MKRRVKLIVDILMFGLYLYLVNYHAGMGLLLHALIGIVLVVLFLLHHVLNLGWYRSLFRGRYNMRRGVLTAVNLLLSITMLLMILSSVMISGMVFEFSRIPVDGGFRTLHVRTSSWSFLLMAVHLGLHMHGKLQKVEWKLKTSAFEYIYYFFSVAFPVAGLICLTQSRVWENLFSHGSSVAYRYTDLQQCMLAACAALGICFLVHWILKFTNRIKHKKDDDGRWSGGYNGLFYL